VFVKFSKKRFEKNGGIGRFLKRTIAFWLACCSPQTGGFGGSAPILIGSLAAL
jgi:hypothetical protein